MTLNKGALGISVLRVLTLLESGFRFSHRKSVVFRFFLSFAVCSFSLSACGFSFLKHLQTGRSDFVLSAVFGLKQKKKIARKQENTFLACYVLFSQFRHVMFSREFTFSSFINYACICKWMHVCKTTFE